MNLLRGMTALLIAGALGHGAQPVVRLYTTEDGLTRNFVSNIRRDSRGRLWFCTLDGLSLFDGSRFSSYTTSDGLPHSVVTDILDAGDGAYWLATGVGLYLFRPRTAAPASFDKVPLAHAGAAANVLFRDASGQVWCGTSQGLERVVTGPWPHGETVRLMVANEGERPHDVRSLAQDKTGSVWIGTGAGLLRYQSGAVTRFGDTCSDHSVRDLLVDRQGILWAGYRNGFGRIDVTRTPVRAVNSCFASGDRRGDVQSLHEGQDGTVWIGALGLSHYRPGGNPPLEFMNAGSLLGTQYIYSLAEDSAGNLWAAVGRNGVMRVLSPRFTHFEETDGLESVRVNTLTEGPDGTLYAVTGVRHTLNRLEGERFRAVDVRPPPLVSDFGPGVQHSALIDTRNEWWIATEQGLLRYPSTVRFEDLAHTAPKAHYGKGAGLPTNSIHRVFEDCGGNIWVGAAATVARWNAATEGWEDFSARIHGVLGHRGSLQSLAEDKAGNLWMGFRTHGLVRYSPGSLQLVSEGLPAGALQALLVDGKGRLWVGSAGGVARIDEPAAEAPRVSYALPAGRLRSPEVFSMAEDKQGRIYMATGKGIDRLDPATGEMVYYNAGIGPPSGETHVLYRDRSGAIWLGSSTGLTRYVPEPESLGPPEPPGIREVRVSGVPVLVSDQGERQVTLAPIAEDSGAIEISFGSVDFSVENRVRYRYRLLPVDTHWRESSGQRTVQYAGLGPNVYGFEVQAIGHAAAIPPAIAVVNFEVRGPLYARWWFLVLLGAAGVAILYAAHAYRLRHQLAMEKMRSQLAADLHDDLGSGLAEIAILTEVAKQQNSTTQLDFVAQRARELRRSMSDIVWSVDPAGDNLAHSIHRCRETAITLLGNIQLEFVAPPDSVTAAIRLTPQQRRQIVLWFKEAATNVARHAGASRVRVEIRNDGGRLAMAIQDDGCGFDAASVSEGNGLRSLRQRAKALRGELILETRPGEGTLAKLIAPLAGNASEEG
ncbi:MAG: two-component regulator propeller domain-containing protein [Bryobacteraceae bacterium]